MLSDSPMKQNNLNEIFHFVARKITTTTQIDFGLLHKVYVSLATVKNYVRHNDPHFFNSIAIETSTYCNRTCHYCPNSKHETPKLFMEERVFKKAIERAKEIDFSGAMNYHFYNEPTLDERLPDFIAYAREQLPKCLHRLITNGDFLTLDLADKYVAAGVSEFTITNHNKNPEAFEKKIRPVVEKYPLIARVGTLQGIELSNRGGAIEVENKARGTVCIQPLKSLQIDYLGDVLLCCNDYFREYAWGNIMEKSFYEIWNNDEFSDIRKELRRGITRLEICRKCLE